MRNRILQDIKQDYYQQNYSNDGQRFVAWYLRNIHGLNTIEAKDCITDGANDKQIDAVYIDNQDSTIYIIQGKFYNCDEIDAEPLREVVSSWMQIKDLEHLQENANAKLVVKINEISRALEDDYEICFEFITTSKLTQQASADFEIFRKFISENEDINASFVIVDDEMLQAKYDEALNKTNSYINYDFTIETDKCMQMELNGIKTILAAVQLKECVNIPGIKDGKLFRKNVRQSLGRSNKVNKGIARTIKNDSGDFFFYHNGITAICKSIELNGTRLSVKDFNVVNGCQSLSTIFGCGETAKKSNGYILFKFYEIADNAKVDNITNSTNSQSAVKARDMRSNDKIVLSLKKTYEQTYTDGYLITKRGEIVDQTKFNMLHVNELTAMGKELIAWHSQRPNLSYGETRIFDTYFSQLFHKEYKAEDMQALKEMFDAIIKLWEPTNPMGLNEALLAMKAYAPYHQLYAISALANEVNKKVGKTPSPAKVYKQLSDAKMFEFVLEFTGNVLNVSFETANESSYEAGKVFVPQNWIKSKASVIAINSAIKNQLSSLKILPTSKETINKLSTCLTLTENDFADRYSAD